MGLGNPLLHQDWIGACFKCGPVAAELAVAGGDLVAGRLDPVLVGIIVLGVGDGLQGVVEVGGGEGLAYPRVEQFDDLVFAQVDAARVGQALCVGVLGRVGAAVVIAAVVEAADHASLAQSAVQQPGQGVVAFAAAGLAFYVRSTRASADAGLHLLEGVVVDQTLMRGDVGVDPVVLRVPAHLGLVPQRDVFDVEEHFGLSLLVPDLPAGVAGVGQDDADG